MKVTKYIIEFKEDKPNCIKCGKRIKIGEVSFEFRPDRGFNCTDEERNRIWCKKCVPRDAKVYKGTQLKWEQ